LAASLETLRIPVFRMQVLERNVVRERPVAIALPLTSCVPAKALGRLSQGRCHRGEEKCIPMNLGIWRADSERNRIA
jgi:hypothetical protein